MHKVQGLKEGGCPFWTQEKVKYSAISACALRQAKSLEALFLLGKVKRKTIKSDPEISDWYESLSAESFLG